MTSAPYPDDGDDRAPPVRRRGLKVAAAAVAVAVIAGLAGYAYVETTPPRGGEVPLIKAEPGPAKKRPDTRPPGAAARCAVAILGSLPPRRDLHRRRSLARVR